MRWLLPALILTIGCASAPVAPPRCVKQPTNYEKCAQHCAEVDGGDPAMLENATDITCLCRRQPLGT